MIYFRFLVVVSVFGAAAAAAAGSAATTVGVSLGALPFVAGGADFLDCANCAQSSRLEKLSHQLHTLTTGFEPDPMTPARAPMAPNRVRREARMKPPTCGLD